MRIDLDGFHFALEYFRGRKLTDLVLVVRDAAKAAGTGAKSVHPFEDAPAAFAGAHYVVQATPLGMAGMPPQPGSVVDALARTDANAIVCDLVYVPIETPMLGRARGLGRTAVDGLAALIGQAAPAFELFFGVPAPREHDAELRERLER